MAYLGVVSVLKAQMQLNKYVYNLVHFFYSRSSYYFFNYLYLFC